MNGEGPDRRFRDQDVWLTSFTDLVLVRCPRCGARAEVRPWPAPADPSAPGAWRLPRRLTCLHCGHAKDLAVGRSPNAVVFGGPIDPYFRLPLLLQAPCCGELLWAFNLDHVELLEQMVGAKLRERPNRDPYVPTTMVEKLPAWLKAADNRTAVQRSLAKLRDLATA